MVHYESIGDLNRHVRSYDSLADSLLHFRDSKSDGLLNPDCMTVSFRNNKQSIYIALAIIFLIGFQAIVYYQSLWPFFLTVDPDGSETFYGAMFTLYSLFAATTSIIFGWISNRVGVKLPVLIGLLFIGAAYVLMLSVYLFPGMIGKWLLLISRILAGIGSGADAPLFAYTVAAVAVHERSKIVAIRTIIQILAYILGPFLQTVAAVAGYPGIKWGILSINMYTIPSLVIFLATIIAATVLHLYFRDFDLSGKKETITRESAKIDLSTIWISSYVRTSNCLLSNGVVSVSTPVAMMMFSWSGPEAVWNTGIFYSVLGVFMVPFTFFVGIYCMKYIRERFLMLFGNLFLLVGVFMAFPWPWYPQLQPTPEFTNISTYQLQEYTHDINHIDAIFRVSSSYNYRTHINISTVNNYTHYPAYPSACNFDWCSRTPIMFISLSCVCFVLTYISQEMIKVPATVLYTNMLGPEPQGMWQGIYACLEMLAAGLGPLVYNYIFEQYGPQIMFLMSILLILSALLPQIVVYKRLLSWYESNQITSPYKVKKWG